MLWGIDVAEHQGTIDWNVVKSQIDFAIIRAGNSQLWGRNDRLTYDYTFYRNRDEARRLGIPRGYYYFTSRQNPQDEVNDFKAIVGDLEPGESIWLDIEAEYTYGDVPGYVATWLSIAEEAFGVKAHLYTMGSTVQAFQGGWGTVVGSGSKLWMAAYSGGYWKDYYASSWPDSLTIWQYSSTFNMNGIPDNTVDVNYFYGDNFVSLGKGNEQKQEEIELGLLTIEQHDMYKDRVIHPHGKEVWYGFVDEALEDSWVLVGLPHYLGLTEPNVNLDYWVYIVPNNPNPNGAGTIEVAHGTLNAENGFYAQPKLPENSFGTVQVDYSSPDIGRRPFIRSHGVKKVV